MLSKDQIQNFNTNGYLLFDRLIGETELENLRAAASRIVEAFDIMKNQAVFTTTDRDRGRDQYFIDSAENIFCFLEADAFDAEGKLCRPKMQCINKIGHAMHDLDPAFTHFARLPVFGEMMRDLGYVAPVLWQSMYIFKQPRIGGEVRWHQDASYLITEPANVTGLWIAMEDAHKNNGCLWVQPGGHKSPLREVFEVAPCHSSGELKQLDNTPWPSLDEAVAVEVAAGSVIVFNDHLPHYSSHNHSAQSRQALTLHVSDIDANWSDKNWLQRDELCSAGRECNSPCGSAKIVGPLLGNCSCVALPPASLQSCASDLHGWRKCRGLSGTIPA
jgi:phytanoyl-CoA hydroxylase